MPKKAKKKVAVKATKKKAVTRKTGPKPKKKAKAAPAKKRGKAVDGFILKSGTSDQFVSIDHDWTDVIDRALVFKTKEAAAKYKVKACADTDPITGKPVIVNVQNSKPVPYKKHFATDYKITDDGNLLTTLRLASGTKGVPIAKALKGYREVFKKRLKNIQADIDLNVSNHAKVIKSLKNDMKLLTKNFKQIEKSVAKHG